MDSTGVTGISGTFGTSAVTASTSGRLTLDRVTQDFSHLPPLPEVAVKLMDYLRDDDVDIQQVALLLSQDPVLVAKVLRVANSSLYGLTRRVSTMHDAVNVLGLRAVQTLVIATAMAALFQSMEKPLAEAGYDAHGFWRHSIGAALCARLIVRETGGDPESAFIAALLHDIGYLILAARFPEHYAQVINYRELRDCHRIQAENEWLGFSHAQIGAAFADNWSFPGEIHDAIAYHHEPQDPGFSPLAGVTHLADIMAHVLNFSGDPHPLAPDLSEAIWQRLGLDWDIFKTLLARAEQQFSETHALFC